MALSVYMSLQGCAETIAAQEVTLLPCGSFSPADKSSIHPAPCNFQFH